MNESQIQKIRLLIKEFRISKPIVARKMGMAESTFKIKLSENYPTQNFDEGELYQLKLVIQELKEMIVCAE